MTDFTDRLRLTLQETGTNENTWGEVLNTQLALLEDAISGKTVVNVSTGTNITLSTSSGTSDESRRAILSLEGEPTSNINIEIPLVEKVYVVDNLATGSFNMTVKTSTGTGYTFNGGDNRLFIIYCDGEDVKLVSQEINTETGTTQPFGTVNAENMNISEDLDVTGNSSGKFINVTENDTTSGYLNDKIEISAGLAKTLINGGGDELLQLAVDVADIQQTNTVVSGATRTNSTQPDFIRANSAALEFDILATTTPLIVNINNAEVTVSSNINVTSVPIPPTSNNTCTVNDSSLSGGLKSKYQGEYDTVLTIGNVGTQITDRVGQWATFETPTGEILYGYIKSSTEITDVRRGYFFDDSGDPIARGVLNDNDTLTLLSTSWIFIEDDGTTATFTNKSPIYSFEEPTGLSVESNDYWFDLNNNVWKRNNGSSWVTIDRTLIGVASNDSTGVIGTRSENFTKVRSNKNTLDVEVLSNTQVRTKKGKNFVSVNGNFLAFDLSQITWDITDHLDTGLTEASDTVYYLYLTEKGEPVISDELPYDLTDTLKGYYHPYEAWRCVGSFLNDGSSNISQTKATAEVVSGIEKYEASGDFLCPVGVDGAELILVGGGGGGGSSTSTTNTRTSGGGGGAGGSVVKSLNFGSSFSVTPYVIGAGGASTGTGGNSTFLSLTASGGSGGINGKGGGAGGAATGGDLNVKGGGGSGGGTNNNASQDVVSFGGGSGGSSIIGKGGNGASTNNVGGAADGFGGGGGGGSSRNINKAGGAGKSGVLLIKYGVGK